jgi:hypothetical protein
METWGKRCTYLHFVTTQVCAYFLLWKSFLMFMNIHFKASALPIALLKISHENGKCSWRRPAKFLCSWIFKFVTTCTYKVLLFNISKIFLKVYDFIYPISFCEVLNYVKTDPTDSFQGHIIYWTTVNSINQYFRKFVLKIFPENWRILLCKGWVQFFSSTNLQPISGNHSYKTNKL